MHSRFQDIRSRIQEQPTWYDENGTPRYGKFEPDLAPDIYSRVVVLMRIGCQSCDQRFDVEMHLSLFDRFKPNKRPPKSWHYGDPPAHGCVGDTMNCTDLEVLEVWTKDEMRNWARVPELEGAIDQPEDTP